MLFENHKTLRLGAVSLLLGVGLSACATAPQNVPVQNVPSSQAANGTPRGVQSINQLNALQAEIRELRNQLEEQQFEVENLKQRQQDLFQGLDSRLRVSEAMQRGGNVIGPDGSVTTPGMLPPLGADGQAGNPANPGAVSGSTAPGTVVVGSTVPAVAPPSSTSAPSPTAGVDQQALYDQGFDFLKKSQYTQAIGLFEQLVSQFPNGGLADDASYWIGEANYVNRQYEAAIQAFRKVVAQYPQSDRVPEALLKVGYVQYDIGDYQNARTTFQDVLRRYPDHPVSISAKSRLQRIEQGLSG